MQGVGFRFTAEKVAASLSLTGWVMNTPGGNVEVACEGEEDKIASFMDKIKDAMAGYVNSTKVNWQDYTGEFDSFGIRFY